MAAAIARKSWRLWSFGTVQFVQNLDTGELLNAFGYQPDFPGGPWRLLEDAGEPVLLGLEGTDETRAIVFPKAHLKIRVTEDAPDQHGNIQDWVTFEAAPGSELKTTLLS